MAVTKSRCTFDTAENIRCMANRNLFFLYSGAALDADEMASQSVRLKEEQLRREEEKLRDIEIKVQKEIQEKRQELLAKEEALRSLEARLAAAQLQDAA